MSRWRQQIGNDNNNYCNCKRDVELETIHRIIRRCSASRFRVDSDRTRLGGTWLALIQIILRGTRAYKIIIVKSVILLWYRHRDFGRKKVKKARWRRYAWIRNNFRIVKKNQSRITIRNIESVIEMAPVYRRLFTNDGCTGIR